MAIAPGTQQINRYYDIYRDKEITFTKETLHYLRIDPRQIYIKLGGGQWPCIINSTSFQFVKIIIGVGSGALGQIKKDRNMPVQVRYCFIQEDNTPLSFFVTGHVTEFSSFEGTNELLLLTISFTQQPPDDLILRLGQFIDTNENFVNRREERIIINKEIIRRIGMEKEESIVAIQNVPRRCILRDISFGGAKIMCLGIPKFLIGKECSLKLSFVEPQVTFDIPGEIKLADTMEGRKDIVVVCIAFNPSQIPMQYKVLINEFITSNRKTLLELNKIAQRQQQQAQQAAAEAETPAAPVASSPASNGPLKTMGADYEVRQAIINRNK
ncbi:MAG: PilZ domain-containing protein [Treponema sp.]|uniref:PilZ domain-containing protein n=1 Tax=Treponema sp. TaxID=166 RepID=UPI00298E6EBF|nr:PilZ domain-containing protein [Treponema sp.]MCQ2600916.1 PilZ domain-containing protein [Treponema sp.]